MLHELWPLWLLWPLRQLSNAISPVNAILMRETFSIYCVLITLGNVGVSCKGWWNVLKANLLMLEVINVHVMEKKKYAGIGISLVLCILNAYLLNTVTVVVCFSKHTYCFLSLIV